jgi:carboxypeptidase T
MVRQRLRGRSLALVVLALLLASGLSPTQGNARTGQESGPHEFPPGDERYHTYPELVTELRALVAAHRDVARLHEIGRSSEGRPLWRVTITDHPGVDEGEPEVLLDGLAHGDEHLSAEAPLRTIRWLLEGRARDARIARIVSTRVVHVVPMLNPDGGTWDIAGGRYRDWRKTRERHADGTIGTDPNRNHPYRWGCCGGSSANGGSPMYRGPSPWSSAEAAALAAFVRSRVLGGRQRIDVALSLHASGRFVMWPFHWTSEDLRADLRASDRAAAVALARGIASRTGYRAFQAGDFYRADGTFSDWATARHRVLALVLELGPLSHDPHPDEVIGPELARVRPGLLWALESAGCLRAPRHANCPSA